MMFDYEGSWFQTETIRWCPMISILSEL